MNDAPERIWIDACGGNWSPVSGGTQGHEYIRADKVDALVEALTECEAEIDQYIRQEYPGDHPVHARYRARDFAANPARSALAAFKGDAQ